MLWQSLVFSFKEKKQKLLAYDGGPDYFFLCFSDNTTGEQTYGGGRYIDVPRPEKLSSSCIIDFNRAYNPPCVFIDYATCPIPPKENHIDLNITAGERSLEK